MAFTATTKIPLYSRGDGRWTQKKMPSRSHKNHQIKDKQKERKRQLGRDDNENEDKSGEMTVKNELTPWT